MFQSGGLPTVKEPGGLTTSGDADKDLDVMAAGKRPPEMDRLPPPLKKLPVLQGMGITLRELRVSDAKSLLALLTTEEVTRFISPPPTTVEGFERFISWAVREREAGA